MYNSKIYADSFSTFGEPIYLKKSGGWLLKRIILGTNYYDAMNCYPFFICDNPDNLIEDLRELKNIVSVMLILSPFCNLKNIEFFDSYLKFKDHFIVDLCKNNKIPNNHIRNIKTGMKNIISIWVRPDEFVDEWYSLYNNLIKRHNIKGMIAFSKDCFKKQLLVSGAKIISAQINDRFVGAIIWYTFKDLVFYHLGAQSEEGYENKSSFVLFNESINYFKGLGFKYVCLGSGSGLEKKEDGLTRFKRGWANCTTPVYMCTKILDTKVYADLTKCMDKSIQYFPLYRYGEF